MLLYRYIIKELLFPFLASLSVIVFLFVMQQAVLLLDRIVAKGLDPLIVLEVFAIQLGWIMALAVPMAILTATLMTFGRMSGDNEITAIKASGRSMLSLLAPVFSAALVMTVSLVFFHDLVLPEANHRAANLLSDISRKQPAAFIEPQVLIRDFENYTLYTHEVDPITGELSGIRILTDAPGQNPTVTVASSGKIRMTNDEQYLELILNDGETHSYPEDRSAEYYVGRFQRQVVYIENVDSELTRTSSEYRSDREKNISMMLADISNLKNSNNIAATEYQLIIDTLKGEINELDSLATALNPNPEHFESFNQWVKEIPKKVQFQNSLKRRKNLAERTVRRINSNNQLIVQYMVEVHKKFAIPLACLLFVLIGTPLGIMARRGGLAVGASYSVFFFIAYWAFLITGESMADKQIISPFWGMWTGNMVIGLFGIILTILMLRETTINFYYLKNLFKFSGNKGNKVIHFFSNLYILKLPGLIFRFPRIVMKWLMGTLPAYLTGMFLRFTAGLLIAILVIFIVVDYVGNLKFFEHASLTEAGLYYLYYIPWIFQTILPVVLLLATMFSIGQMAKNSEITALKASGMSVRRLSIPLLLTGFLFSVASFYGGEYLLPSANEARTELRAVMRTPPEQRENIAKRREFRRRFYYFGNPNTMYYFDEFSVNPQFAKGVQRQTFRYDGLAERIDAQEMVFDEEKGWMYINARKRNFTSDGSTLMTFDTLNDTILSSTPTEMIQKVRSERELSYWELRKYIEMAKNRGEQVHRLMAEMEFKIALPFMNFVVILLGLGITARTGRKGGPVLFGIGLGLTFVYYLIVRFAIVFAQNGHISPMAGAWSGNILFLLIGIILYRKAAH